MTREQAKELLPVIAAFAEGADVQYCDQYGRWRDSPNLNYTASWPKWRIKPTPLECWVQFHENKGFRFNAPGIDFAEAGWRNVKMREVME